jgi:hypothetical protein
MRWHVWLVALAAFLVVWAPCVLGQLPMLVAGGYFTTAGGIPANSIAQWNGTAWSPLGSGIKGTVRDLTVFKNQLVVAGSFTSAGGATANRIAQWNGAAWSALDSGMNDMVNALAVFNNQLIAGGEFITAGGVSALYIAQWNGVVWSPLGIGMSDDVRALVVFNNQLIAGGAFTTAGGVVVNCIAQWNGAVWSALGSGMGNAYGRPSVDALVVFNNQLIAGGDFSTAGGVVVNYIAPWNGAAWSSLGGGMRSGGIYAPVFALAVFNSQLIAGGDYTTAGGVSANRIAQWNGAAWSPLGSGMNNTVYDLTVFNNRLLVGGTFTTAGGISANYIAEWSGTAWYRLGSGMSNTVRSLTVYTLPANPPTTPPTIPPTYPCNCTGCPPLTLRARQYAVVSTPSCAVGDYMAISPSIESTSSDTFRIYTVDDVNLNLYQSGSTFSYYAANSAPNPVSCFSTGGYSGDPKLAKLNIIIDCANPLLACALQYRVLYLCVPVTDATVTSAIMDGSAQTLMTSGYVRRLEVARSVQDYVSIEANDSLWPQQ